MKDGYYSVITDPARPGSVPIGGWSQNPENRTPYSQQFGAADSVWIALSVLSSNGVNATRSLTVAVL